MRIKNAILAPSLEK